MTTEDIDHDFLNGNAKAIKASGACWGCQKKELPDSKFHHHCSRCEEENFIPAPFCSQACFDESAARHSEWHETRAQDYKKVWSTDKAPKEMLEEFASDGEYKASIAKAWDMMQSLDFIGAKEVLESAIKLDSSRASAFYELGRAFEASGQISQALDYYELACPRRAYSALTGLVGNQVNTAKRLLFLLTSAWTEVIYAAVCKYLSEIDQNIYRAKPMWFTNDEMLKRVTKLAYHTMKRHYVTKQEELWRIALLRAYVLNGSIHKGQFLPSLWSQVPRSKEDLEEAAKFFKIASRLCEEEDKRIEFQTEAERCEKAASESQASRRSNTIEAGAWVSIHDLDGEQGVELNGKIGMVEDWPYFNDRLKISIDDSGTLHLIFPEHVTRVSLKESQMALLSCLEKSTQRIILEKAIEKKAVQALTFHMLPLSAEELQP